jgi:small conductance mechanosensitive channel
MSRPHNFRRRWLLLLVVATCLAAVACRATAQMPPLTGTQPKATEQRSSPAAESEGEPFRVPTLRDLQNWGKEHGLSVLAIIVVIAATLWLAGLLEGRIVRLLARGDGRESSAERESRARTLVGVLNNALRTAALAIGAIMILKEFAIPIEPLLGGVAVIGLAVAFGAQSLIKDYFTGFMVLLEQQYVLGDVVKIGDITGQVENVTLRLTVLRDFEGRVHFIPHGQITTVTNLTHGWSRAVIDVNIGYEEDPDRVVQVLTDLTRELRADPKFGEMIVDDVTMLGVDTLGDSAVTIKFGIKTRPGKQWDVKREMLRRIKRRFAELGIDIPFPQRMVWVRGEGSGFGVQGSAGQGRAGEEGTGKSGQETGDRTAETGEDSQE